MTWLTDCVTVSWTDDDSELRRTGIGGSRVATVAGLNPYKTAMQQFEEDAGLKDREPFDDAARRRMRWGQLSEPLHLQLLREEHNLDCTSWEHITESRGLDPALHWACISHDNPRHFATPDAVTKDGNLVELKAPRQSMRYKHTSAGGWREGPPVMYQAQLYWQMYVTGARAGCISALIDGQLHPDGPWWYEWDDYRIAQLVRCADTYLAAIDNNEPPPLTVVQW